MATVYAIIPVFIIILSGYICRYYQFVSKEFWIGAEKITYYFLFPCLLFSKMSVADLTGIDFVKPIILILLLFVSMTIIFILCKPFFKLKNSSFTSVYQGGIRFNTYIGLAAISGLYGPEGLVVGVIIAALMIPTINTLCVLVLEFYSDIEGENTYKRIGKSVATNPLIVACVTGLGVNLVGISIPFVLIETITIFSRAALPLGLLVVGAALVLNSIKSSYFPVIIACLSKFFILPVLTMALCSLLAIEPMIKNVLIVLTCLPTATASYVLAKKLGGDFELMATIITVQTLLAVIMMPLMLFIFSAY